MAPLLLAFHSPSLSREKGLGEGGRQEPGRGKAETAEPGFGVLGSGAGMAALSATVLPASRRLPSVLCQGGPWRWSTGHCRAPSRGRGTERGQGSAPDTRDTGRVPPAAALPPGLPFPLPGDAAHSPHLSCGCRLVGLGGTPGAVRACCHPWAVPIASWCSRDEGLKAWASGRSVCLRRAASQELPPRLHACTPAPSSLQPPAALTLPDFLLSLS